MQAFRFNGGNRACRLGVSTAVIGLFFAGMIPQASASRAQFGASPDNSLSLLTQTIQSATRTLTINIYQFDRPVITDAITQAIAKGVKLKILIEAQPFQNNGPKNMTKQGWVAAKAILDAIKAAPAGDSHLYLMRSWQTKDRRFVFDHAKYLVVDGKRALITSENFTATGHPDAGKRGNRGWEVVIDDAALAGQLENLFNGDAAPGLPDVDEPRDIKIPDSAADASPREVVPRTLRAKAIGEGDVNSAQLLAAPNALPPLLQYIESAKKTLDVEEMSMPLQWRSPHVALNPLVGAWIEAAKRGVAVRVLLNDDRVFDEADKPRDEDKLPNLRTVRALLEAAQCQKLPIEAKIIDIDKTQITYIHNKGSIADGKSVIVGSINGTQNSITKNREIAVAIQSRDAGKYYGKLFENDWNKSEAIKNLSVDCKQMAIDRLAPFDLLRSP